MSWPPPVLPTNRTNATVQQNTHPADHNAANLAINDLVTKVKATKVTAGGRADLVSASNGLFKLVFTTMVVDGVSITGMIPTNVVYTITNTEGAGGSGQKSAVYFQGTINGTPMVGGASCAVMWVASGTAA